MEKYGTTDASLTEGLRNEEHELMLELMGANDVSEMGKQASPDTVRNLEQRLGLVRNRITEIDLRQSKQRSEKEVNS